MPLPLAGAALGAIGRAILPRVVGSVGSQALGQVATQGGRAAIGEAASSVASQAGRQEVLQRLKRQAIDKAVREGPRAAFRAFGGDRVPILDKAFNYVDSSRVKSMDEKERVRVESQKQAEREHFENIKAQEKEQALRDKEAEALRKEQEKEVAKAQKEAEKAAARAEKEAEKARKKAEAEAEKARKKSESEQQKQENQPPKKTKRKPKKDGGNSEVPQSGGGSEPPIIVQPPAVNVPPPTFVPIPTPRPMMVPLPIPLPQVQPDTGGAEPGLVKDNSAEDTEAKVAAEHQADAQEQMAKYSAGSAMALGHLVDQSDKTNNLLEKQAENADAGGWMSMLMGASGSMLKMAIPGIIFGATKLDEYAKESLDGVVEKTGDMMDDVGDFLSNAVDSLKEKTNAFLRSMGFAGSDSAKTTNAATTNVDRSRVTTTGSAAPTAYSTNADMNDVIGSAFAPFGSIPGEVKEQPLSPTQIRTESGRIFEQSEVDPLNDFKDGKIVRTPKGPGDAVVNAMNASLIKQTQSAIDRGVKYGFGVKNSSTGAIDCSGWVAETNRNMIDSLNQEAGNVDMSEAKKLFPDGAAMIVEKIAKTTGEMMTSEELTPETLKEGMIIGEDNGAKSWDAGRFMGIDHITQVVRDPETGKLMISQSSGGKGVSLTDAEQYLERKKSRGTKLFGVDTNQAIAMTTGVDPTTISPMERTITPSLIESGAQLAQQTAPQAPPIIMPPAPQASAPQPSQGGGQVGAGAPMMTRNPQSTIAAINRSRMSQSMPT